MWSPFSPSIGQFQSTSWCETQAWSPTSYGLSIQWPDQRRGKLLPWTNISHFYSRKSVTEVYLCILLIKVKSYSQICTCMCISASMNCPLGLTCKCIHLTVYPYAVCRCPHTTKCVFILSLHPLHKWPTISIFACVKSVSKRSPHNKIHWPLLF